MAAPVQSARWPVGALTGREGLVTAIAMMARGVGGGGGGNKNTDDGGFVKMFCVIEILRVDGGRSQNVLCCWSIKYQWRPADRAEIPGFEKEHSLKAYD